VFENRECVYTDCSNSDNSRFYAVIIQYTSKCNTEKLLRLVRSWTPGSRRADYNFQLCPEEEAEELTGYRRNGVAPVGMKQAIPVIVSHRIASLSPCFLWLGGGHPDIKLGCSVTELVKATGARVEDVTM